MQYLAAILMLCIGLVVGWSVGLRSAPSPYVPVESRRVPYLTEPAASRLRLDSLVLRRKSGFSPRPQYEISFSDNGRVVYRGSVRGSGLAPGTEILGRAGDYFTRIEPSEFKQLVSLAMWPERWSVNMPPPPIDAPYAEVTLFFSKVLIGEGDPEFAQMIEQALSGAEWDSTAEVNR